jgi:glycosyltransferase involved in cell wall biosynthesis
MVNLLTILERSGLAYDLVTLHDRASGRRLLATQAETMLVFPSRWSQVERWRQWRWLRATMRGGDYDAVIAFGPIANGLVALARPQGGPRIVVSERGDPFIPRRRTWNRWFMWLYRRADVAVVATEGLAVEMRLDWRRPREVRVIPNSLAPQIPILDRREPREPVIVAVGRLVPSKRFADLIAAFLLLGPRAAGWSVSLVGDGAERANLEALVAERGLAGRVRLLGFHEAPWQILATADIFVSCSQNEGFPNVILEALASGCAVVSSDCRFGPREVIEDGVSGILYPVGDVDRLAKVLGELIDDPARRGALAYAGSRRVKRFTIDAVAPLWLRLIGGSPATHGG